MSGYIEPTIDQAILESQENVVAKDNDSTDSEEFGDRVKAIVARWGWREPTRNVLLEAQLHDNVQRHGLKTLDIMVRLGLIRDDQIPEILEKQKDSASSGNKRRAYDIAADLSQNKQLTEDSKNRVLAAANNIQYIESIDNASIRLHDAMFSENQRLKECCLEMNAVLCQIQGGNSVLIFSDYGDEYNSFSKMGRPEKQANVIYREIDDDSRLLLAISHPDIVAKATRKIQTGGESQDNDQRVSIAALLADRDKTKQKIGSILRYACNSGASDIHVDPKEYHKQIPIVIKVHGIGRLIPTNMEPSMDEYQKIKDYLITISGGSDSFGQKILLPEDGHFIVMDEADNRFNVRCSFMPDGNQFTFSEQLISINMRVIKHGTGAVDLKEQNVPSDVVDLLTKNAELGHGATYIVGPTGSGKSTTMFGIVEIHRQLYGTTKTRISFEDPVEGDAPGIQQVQISKRAKKDYPNPYEPYSRGQLRHAPNLLLYGEVRDGDSAVAVGQSSATGHYVLTSLHAETPTTAVERLLNMVPTGYRHMVIENLGMIIGQRLVPTLCEKCKIERECTAEERQKLHYWLTKKDQADLFELIPERMSFPSERGCQYCRYFGKSGVAPIYEVVDLFPKHKRELLQPGADIESIIKSARHKSMQESALELLEQGKVDFMAFLG